MADRLDAATELRAVELCVGAPEPIDLAATGTDGAHVNERFVLPLPYTGDGSRRKLSVTGGTAENLYPPNRFKGLGLIDLEFARMNTMSLHFMSSKTRLSLRLWGIA
jgi:hypothetical protein